MPSTCCVPGCRGNYSSGGPKVCTYKFPNDEVQERRWIVAIRRKNFNVTRHSRVCELHFKKNDFETEASAFDPKTGRTITAPLYVKRLKKGVIPSILPSTIKSSSSRETPSEKRKRLETEQLKTALNKSLKSTSVENSDPKITAEVSSNSSTSRSSGIERKKKVNKMVKKKTSSTKAAHSKKANSIPNPPNLSNGVDENEESNEKNELNSSTLIPVIYVKEEPIWEVDISNNASKNNADESTSENVQITGVRTLSSESNAPSNEENTDKKPEENFDSAFYTKPLNMDLRDQAFGSFIACEISNLRDNPTLYIKTKQSILKILTEAHFEQMSVDNKS